GAGGAPPEFAEQEKAGGMYPVAIVELEEGPKVIGQIADVNTKDVKMGMPVSTELRKVYSEEGVIRYGFKFIPEELSR
ncbi:MAG: OB-fold domain-containing protein, partial [Candidatus Thermoplasmatota archaeon]|nr:OB-fold domain-containing protein [Candidatus Thermoplasmatota archaeon]